MVYRTFLEQGLRSALLHLGAQLSDQLDSDAMQASALGGVSVLVCEYAQGTGLDKCHHSHLSRCEQQELALLNWVGGSSLALLGLLLERWTALCMGLEGAPRRAASGGGEGHQLGIAATDQRLPCICSSLNATRGCWQLRLSWQPR